MKKSKRTVEKTIVPTRPAGLKPWHFAIVFAGAFIAVLIAYLPALRGPFVFDDIYLPFTEQEYDQAPLRVWIGSVRPLLMFTFWANYRLSGLEPFSYHLVNVVLHFITGVFVFLIIRRLLQWAGMEGRVREIVALAGGGLFLLHPVQTEAVAYIASRSETLSTLFFYAAFALFVYRRSSAISWPEAVGVLLLFGAAVNTKEHTAVLPLLLLLTDYYWNPGFSFAGIRKNWRLYAPIAAGGALAARMVWRILRWSDTAGFALPEFTWVQYFYTQCRAIWLYIRLFFLPYGQNVDHDFAISRSIMDHGAAIWLAGLIALVVAAVYYRRRYPLASYGFLVFLILLAPTSSVIPILDPVAEHRLYLPIVGLLLVVAEFLRRWRVSRTTLAASVAGLLLVAGWLTFDRAQVWGSDLALWEDSVAKSPRKARPQFQLAYAYFNRGRCGDALEHYNIVAQVGPTDQRLLIDWALAYDCLHRWDEALAKLQQAAGLQKNAQVYSLLGLVYLRQNKNAEALEALNTAVKLNPRFEFTYVYRARVHAALGDLAAAADDDRRALAINADNDTAREDLAVIEQHMTRAR